MIFFPEGSRRKMSTLQPYCAVTKIAHSVDRHVFIRMKNKYYFVSIHNYPMHLKRKDAKSLEKEIKCFNRRDNVHAHIEELNAKNEEKFGKNSVKILTNHEHNKMIKELKDANMIMDDLRTQAEIELQMKDDIIKSKELEINGLKNKSMKLKIKR